MLPTVETPPETITERSARATRALCGAVGLGTVASTDLKLLTIALAEVAAREAQQNEGFAIRVRGAFNKLKEEKATGAKKQSTGAKSKQPLVLGVLQPIRPSELGRLNPFGTLDPYALVDVYGDAQAKQVLENMPLDEIKKSSAIVEERNPGTGPANRRAKKSYVAYIMEHVTGHS